MLLILVTLALAGDLPTYQNALGRIDERWLWPEKIDHVAMLTAAGRSLEDRLDWLLVDATPTGLHLHSGRWQADVALGGDLPVALAHLEDAVRAAGLPIDADLDLRVEILRGVVSTLDRHTTLLHAAGLERFDERLSGTLSGVGVTIGLVDARLTVKELFADGPAARAGLQEGDTIARIDGISTIGMVPADATGRIRGAAGSRVVLTIQRGEETFDVDIGREELTIPNVVASIGPNGVGVLTIDHFSEQTTQYLQAGLESLRSTGNTDGGVIIDLRGNTGGSLIQSAKAVDAFVSEGLIVTTEGRSRNRVPGLLHDMQARPEYPAWTMPVAVLIDHSSASGSEILAGGLSRLSRALLVGETTYGKGTVQSIYPLDPAIKLKLTVAQYVLADETRVHGVGLEPDVVVEPIRFTEDGVWYADPARGRSARARLWRVEESAGWRAGVPDDAGDQTLALAATLLGSVQGGTRNDALTAVDALSGVLTEAANRAVETTFAVRDIDWTRASGPPGSVEIEASLDVPGDIATGRTTELRATVRNLAGPLHRVAIRLHSVNPDLDDLVLPIGALASGATAVGVVKIHPLLHHPGRTDAVTGTLEADGIPPFEVFDRLVTVASPAPPTLAIDARLVGSGDAARVVMDVHNTGESALSELHLQFDYPSQAGLALALPVEATASIDAHRTARTELGISVASGSKLLPLSLEVEAPGWQRIGKWSLPLRHDGVSTRIRPPSITIDDAAPVASVGLGELTVHVTDDGPLAYVTVTAGTETVDRTRWEPMRVHEERKIAAHPGSGRRINLTVPVPVRAGTNRYVIVAEDRSGLRTEREVYCFGVATAETTADGEPPVGIVPVD